MRYIQRQVSSQSLVVAHVPVSAGPIVASLTKESIDRVCTPRRVRAPWKCASNAEFNDMTRSPMWSRSLRGLGGFAIALQLVSTVKSKRNERERRYPLLRGINEGQP